MSRYRIDFVVVFLVGLVAVGWVGAGYVGSNLLALTVTMVIAACYVAGALELHRYQQATSTLTAAIARLSETPPRLSAWLDGLHSGLRSAVRLRIEGERVALPGPALTPYLVGLLVLLGMLGTLLGMVTTLRGTGAALDSAADLQAIRESLAAPVRGLGFAFGTSIAGVATSAMLGLLSALCRRERAQAAQSLDAKIATTLRIYSQSQQREDTFRLMQRQAEMMPALVDRLQTMMTAIEHQSLALNERLAASQHAFHSKTEAAYARLASSVAQSLKESAAESARAAGAALQPAMEATMTGHAREMAALRETVTHAVQQQLDGLSSGFQATTTTVADLWSKALAGHQRSSESLVQDLRASLDQFTQAFEQRSAGLLDGVSTRLEATADGVSQAWNEALTRQERASESIAERNQHALATAAATFEQHEAALLRAVDQSHADLQAQWAARDEARLAAWRESLGAVAATLSKEWEEAGARAATRQQDICDTLARTASDISAQTQAHASGTIAEISRLVQAASEAPRAAAEVIAELRHKLTDSMARDNAMLEERSRLLETLDTLLDAVNHASTEQRTAVDALVATSADMLARVGTQFTDKVEMETRKLNDVAAQVTGSAVEVASLGEAFGVAVQHFGEANDKLTAHLQRIEAALDKSLMRSDEQLAFYVAQAKEVIDLSMLSQKQIVEDLQQLAAQRASAGAESA
ncbi:DUF802 domain-containing protein [Paraburkholderia phymatum]|uniref:DUF802 domain-containing protein n=1 Tax=Paraburkholderia phymatum TaxID=148447 RepID=A0ACC6UBQ2_9BURK